MSEKENNALQEVTRKLVITPEDVAGAAEFWTHFEIPMPPELSAAIDAFKLNPTIENQDKVKHQIALAIGHTEHEAFKDEMFKEIVEECRTVGYQMSFDNALETKLTEDESK